jgi:hypothetical protein
MEQAEARFAAAERAYEELGAGAWLARCRLDWAQVLLSCEDVRGHASLAGAGDTGRAGSLLDRVLVVAGELDLPRVAARAEALRRETAFS